MTIRSAAHRRTVRVGVASAALALLLGGCSDSSTPAGRTPTSTAASTSATSTTTTTTTAPSTTAPASTSAAPRTSSRATPTQPARRTTSAPPPPEAPVTPAAGAPVIVIDPGHSPTITQTDAATGLVVSDYANEPEMRDVFAVSQLVATQLRAHGYKVVLTKTSVDDRKSLADRAHIANSAGASLALSIHDQAGSNGGIGFRSGNNIVYYQSVGDYRETPSGKKVVFTDSAVAAASKRYGAIFRTQRSNAQGTSVRLQGNVGYDLGSRGLAAGNMWIVQLLSKVPWIYNEAGGNSAGMSGLNATDEATYARGLVAAVEKCIAPPR